MKREIKFRAKSLDGELIYFELHESSQCGDPEVFYANDNDPCESGTEQEYTGLKDWNGKEIYESDICELDCSEKKWQVISNYAQFDFQCNTMQRPLNDHDPAEIEIIGNIYENPELL